MAGSVIVSVSSRLNSVTRAPWPGSVLRLRCWTCRSSGERSGAKRCCSSMVRSDARDSSSDNCAPTRPPGVRRVRRRPSAGRRFATVMLLPSAAQAKVTVSHRFTCDSVDKRDYPSLRQGDALPSSLSRRQRRRPAIGLRRIPFISAIIDQWSKGRWVRQGSGERRFARRLLGQLAVA